MINIFKFYIPAYSYYNSGKDSTAQNLMYTLPIYYYNAYLHRFRAPRHVLYSFLQIIAFDMIVLCKACMIVLSLRHSVILSTCNI